MTTIEKIKAEIERLKDENNNIRCDYNKAYCQGYGDAFVDLLSFLDTLESEKPMDQDEELNEEIKRFVAEYDYERSEDILLIAIVARHFYEIGCRRTAEKFDEIEYNRQRAEEKQMNQEGLEEEINRYLREECSDDDEPGIHEIAEHFAKWGAQWQKEQDIRDMVMSDNRHFNKVYELGKKDMKEQMMKEAVEGEVIQDLKGLNRIKSFSKIPEWLHFGDKVRIIVCKKEEK